MSLRQITHAQPTQRNACYSTGNVCFDFSRETLGFEYLKRVCQHFEAFPELGTALVLHIELLLQKGKELLGKQKIEDVITGTSLKKKDSKGG